LLAVFGPTLMAIALKLASVRTPRRDLSETKTYKRLGYSPISLEEGLRHTAEWLREMGSFDRITH
jgi:nucleoside-diphosphate-sugar epimerase